MMFHRLKPLMKNLSTAGRHPVELSASTDTFSIEHLLHMHDNNYYVC